MKILGNLADHTAAGRSSNSCTKSLSTSGSNPSVTAPEYEHNTAKLAVEAAKNPFQNSHPPLKMLLDRSTKKETKVYAAMPLMVVHVENRMPNSSLLSDCVFSYKSSIH